MKINEAKDYYKELGEDFKINGRQTLKDAKGNIPYHRALYTLQIASDISGSATAVLDLPHDTNGDEKINNEYIKLRRLAQARLSRPQIVSFNALQESESNFLRGNVQIPTKQDGLPDFGAITGELADIRQIGNNARKLVAYDMFCRKRKLIHSVDSDNFSDPYFQLTGYKDFFPFVYEIKSGESRISLGTFFQEDFKNKTKLNPRLLGYLTLLRKLSEIKMIGSMNLIPIMDDDNIDQFTDPDTFSEKTKEVASDLLKRNDMGKILHTTRDLSNDDYSGLDDSPEFEGDAYSNINSVEDIFAIFNPSVDYKRVTSLKSRLPLSVKEKGATEKVVGKAEQIGRVVQSFRAQIQYALTHPDQLGADKVINFYKRMLHHNNTKSMFDTLVDDRDIKTLYREISSLANGDKEHEFYKNLAEELKLQIEERRLGIQSSDHLASIVHKDDESRITSKELKDTVDSITKLPGWKNIPIVLEDLDWNSLGITTPSEFSLTFGNSPHDVSVQMVYDTNIDEKVTFSYSLQLSNGTFDWSILEHPSTNPVLRDSFIAVVKASLDDIQKKAKQVKSLPSPASPTLTLQTKSPQDKAHYVRQTSRVQENSTPSEVDRMQAYFDQEKQRATQDVIIIPSVQELNTLLELIPDGKARTNIMKKISRINANQGIPLKKEQGSKNGPRRSSIRAGEYSIILEEDSFQKNLRVFRTDSISPIKVVHAS